MNKIEKWLRKETEVLTKLVSAAENRLKTAPEGKLCISPKGKRYEFYLVSKVGANKYKKTYISVAKKELISELAQKEYDQRLICNATKRIKAINRFLKTYEATSLEKLYINTHSCRRRLIKKIIISDEEYIKQWQNASYVKKEIQEDGREIFTEKGEKVRSKSEKIIADKLYSMGIPYRYECKLELVGATLYPDFTILKMPQRKEVYLEHLGMLDDKEYSESALRKINVFEKNGIYMGDSLYITHETGKNPLNSKTLDGMLRAWFSNN